MLPAKPQTDWRGKHAQAVKRRYIAIHPQVWLIATWRTKMRRINAEIQNVDRDHPLQNTNIISEGFGNLGK